LSASLESALKVFQDHKFVRIIPAVNLDALIAASILSKNLKEHGIEAPINLDPKAGLDEEDPTLFLDLPRPKPNPKHYELTFDGKTSLAGYATHYVDRVWGVTRWDKVLAIISAVYRGVDRGREGFTGLEKDLLDDLTRAKIITIDLGLRLWGWKKNTLAKALYRTLIPFLPGYSGDPVRTNTVLKSILGVEDPERLYGEHVLSFTEEGLERTKTFLEMLSKNMKYLDTQARNKVLMSLLGFTYTLNYDGFLIDIFEAIGALEIFFSMEDLNIAYTTLISRDDLILASALALYNNQIDELSAEISSHITLVLEKGYAVIETNFVKRPEIFIDILRSINRLPREKPLIIRRDGNMYTSVSEALRLNRRPSEVYSHCNEYQLCMVNENGDFIKA